MLSQACVVDQVVEWLQGPVGPTQNQDRTEELMENQKKMIARTNNSTSSQQPQQGLSAKPSNSNPNNFVASSGNHRGFAHSQFDSARSKPKGSN